MAADLDSQVNFIEQFRAYLSDTRSSSANTVQSYLRDVSAYLNYLQGQGLSPADADGQQMERYAALLRGNGCCAATVTRKIASLRCFYRFLMDAGYTRDNPARQYKQEKLPKALPQVLTDEEILLLFAQPDCSECKGLRDRAMLELLYATGIRVSELIQLDVEDMNLEIGVLYCRSGKKERAIPVYQAAVQAVREYLVRSRQVILCDGTEPALFINLNGKRMSRQGFWKIVKGYAEAACIEKDITPHTLRHSFAAHLLEHGAPLKDIQQMLGHADISSTQVYAQLAQDRFGSVYRECHPRAKEHG